MHLRVLALLACIGLPLVNTACEAPPSVVGAADFEIERRDFHWEIGGSELIAISAGGEARMVYARGVIERQPLDPPDATGRTEQEVLVPHWYEVRWTPSAGQLRALQTVIDDRRILALDERYVDDGVSDGWSRAYTLRALGRTKQITCKNDAPAAIEALDAALVRLTPGEGRRPIEGARELSTEELRAAGLIP